MPTLRESLQTSLGTAYTLSRELLGGGMSRIFVAHDEALGRDVVVKVLSSELSDGLSAERFAREIKLAAALQEPHIVPVLSAGVTVDGTPYYTMPFVRGQTLRQRMAAARVPSTEAVGILRDVARALSYAHRNGVIHRDIKPDNVLLSEGTAVVTDFGIAKAITSARPGAESAGAAASALTSVGTSLGTPAYMAPEQAAGDQIDPRADIYAWGVMAYELLSGTHPFVGKTTAQQYMAAHIAETPAPLGVGVAPPALADLVKRCLAKHPAERPATAADLLQELDQASSAGHATLERPARSRRNAWVAAAVVVAGAGVIASVAMLGRSQAGRSPVLDAAAKRSIAVLSFENASGDTAYDYFAEGLSDELRSQLTGTAGLTVKARTSSAQFRGHTVDPRSVGRKLGADAVLSGVVRRAQDRLSVTAELDDASSGDALWSARYDRPVRDLAFVRDSITEGIASALKVHLAAAGGTGSIGRGTSDFEAYDLFLKGQHAYDVFEYSNAAEYYRHAVERDPSFARAHAALTIAYATIPQMGIANRDSLMALARASLARTFALDPTSSNARLAEAAVRHNEFQLVEAERIVADIIQREPDNLPARIEQIYLLGLLGRMDDVLRATEAAQRLDPLNRSIETMRLYATTLSHRLRDAVDGAHRAIEADPANYIVFWDLSINYSFLNKPDSAVAAMEAAWRADSVNTAPSYLAFSYASVGRWSDVDRLEASRQSRQGNSPDLNRMLFDVIDGRYDDALDALARGLSTKEPVFLAFWFACDLRLDPIKANPRFASIVATVGAKPCPTAGTWPIAPRRR